MEESTNVKYRTRSTQNKVKPKYEYEKKKCSECNKKRKPSDENHQICHVCCKAKKRIISSGNKVIDDFIRYTQTNYSKGNGKMIFVPYEKFENIELIGEGGFSKIYKATWINCKISYRGSLNCSLQKKSKTVALKKLNNSKNITSRELNELKMFYNYALKRNSLNDVYDNYNNLVNIYYGITQDPITQDLIFIMPYYNSDLMHYITRDFYNISWNDKINKLANIIDGLAKIHDVNIIHRDLHSGNILQSGSAKICDLGTSKSATENDNEDSVYGIIPYVAPEVLQGKKYTKASDIYSFGMIMWELMVGRRPFWDRKHDIELIIELCDGLRPPIVTNAPDGYIDLMKECWHSDPENRPKADKISKNIKEMYDNEYIQHVFGNKTEIIKSSNIGPVATNNPDAVYKSRYLSGMIKSATSTRSLGSQFISSKLGQLKNSNSNNKRKPEDNQFGDNFDNGTNNKKTKLTKEVNNDYATKELKFDIDIDSKQFNNGEYITREIDFDI